MRNSPRQPAPQNVLSPASKPPLRLSSLSSKNKEPRKKRNGPKRKPHYTLSPHANKLSPQQDNLSTEFPILSFSPVCGYPREARGQKKLLMSLLRTENCFQDSSSTSCTLRARASGVNGLWMNSRPGISFWLISLS